MRGFRLNGWQRIGIVLSVVWALSISMWFFQHIPEVNDPGIASVYLQCILVSPTLTGGFVRLEQNGLAKRRVRSSERDGRGLRWPPSLSPGFSSTPSCG